MIPIHFSNPSPVRPPLDPTAGQARAQFAHELAKPQYTSQQANPIAQFLNWLENWLQSLVGNVNPQLPGASGIVVLVIVVLVIAALVIGFFVFGLPRINRRSATAGALFGEEDERDSTALRRAASRAAAAGDFRTAIEEGFRAIARGLAERAVVTVFPGTTAHDFAVHAGLAFPGLQAQLASAADVFDGVRYLGAASTEAEWRAIQQLEENLRAVRPTLATQDA